MTTDSEVRRGAGIYSKLVLGFYDALVVKFSNTYAWRCPSPLLLARYNLLIGSHHLDVGTGTGWFLAHAELPEDVDITLMDLNQNSLDSAASRIARLDPRQVVQNVLEPLTDELRRPIFDSIGTNYLFHCVPGAWSEKGVAFANLAESLKPTGVLFGSTILGDQAEHNAVGQFFMRLYNKLGIFHNRDDDVEGLYAALDESFEEVSIEVVGTVAVYTARVPKTR